MPKVTGIFSQFKNLDQIPIGEIAKWLKPVPNPIILENLIANRIFYPQAIPVSKEDMEVDLAILAEALKRQQKQPDFNVFSQRIPDINKLTKMVFGHAG